MTLTAVYKITLHGLFKPLIRGRETKRRKERKKKKNRMQKKK